MAQQGTYPIGTRIPAPTDTATGVVAGTTADIPLSKLYNSTNPLQVTQGGTGVITSTGTGSVVLSNSPTFTGTVSMPAPSFTTPLIVANGGTSVSTLLANGVLLGNGVGAISTTAVGATGTILQGNTGAAPTYSTATYPSTAGTAANVLRSNGTNFLSTALAAADLSNGVTGTGAVVLANNPVLTSETINSTNGGAGALVMTDTTANVGINIKMTGDGATTPAKFVRVSSGNFQIVNNAYSAVILALTDAGSLSAGAINSTPIGSTTPSTAAFTTVTASAATIPLAVTATAAVNTATFTNTTSGTGVALKLLGDGAITPSKVIRVFGGALNVVNDAFSAAILTLTDAGGLSIVGSFTGSGVNGTPIGNTTPSTGAFTTITASSTITPNTLAGIVGTAAADSANAGSVGEYQTATTSNTSMSTGVAMNATSVSLTAGDWDVEAIVAFNAAATTTVSAITTGVGTTSATFGPFGAYADLNATLTTGVSQSQISPVVRVSIASTTTVYAVARSTFGTSTMTATGFIRARRVR